jgi:hypothetical protein
LSVAVALNSVLDILYCEVLVVLVAFGLQLIEGAWLSLTVTRKVFVRLPQLFVAVILTVVVPEGNMRGDVITVVPILYTTVGAGVPVTVTFGPNVTDALQLFNVVDTLILVAVIVGILFGAATPEPEALVQPLTVRVTVYVAAVVTVMEAVVSPVLHSIVPPVGIDKVELPQPFTTVTVGAAGCAGCAFITTLADAVDVHPDALVTV